MGASEPNPVAFAGGSLERRIADLTILCEVSRALQRTLEEDRALYTILTGLTHGRGLAFDRAFVILVDPAEQLLQGRMAAGPSTPEEATALWQGRRDRHRSLGEILDPLLHSDSKIDFRAHPSISRLKIHLARDDSALVRVMKSHETCLAVQGRFQPEDLPVDAQVLEILENGDFAAAPLHLAGKDLGLLLADNPVTRKPVAETNLRLLQIYAQAASAAIQNTRLYRDLLTQIALYEKVNRALHESQHQCLQAERLTTIGKMAALLAHEIRTPLVSIGGFARRLLRSVPPGDNREEEIQIIVSEVDRLERLIDEVLGYGKIAKPQHQAVDINDLLRSIIISMRDSLERGSVRVVLQLDPALPPAEVDQFQIRQAAMNLVKNALDAMPNGGTLELRTSCEGNFFEIGLIDTGVGILQEHWNKLFTPFFTTKAFGTGLGLAIVSQIIENHGGSLRFESVAGQGTSFHIRLPLHPEFARKKPRLPGNGRI